MTEDDADQAIVQAHVRQLMEHFEAVRIFVNRDSEDHRHTRSCSWGGGNFYSQYGQVVAWLEREKGLSRAEGASAMENE